MRVLFIDDDEAPEKPIIEDLLRRSGISTSFLHPEDVLADDLERANVVIVDYFLSDWDERDSVESEARAPRDGLAVIATLRSRLLPALEGRTAGFLPNRPVAFALWSGNLQEATLELPEFVLPGVFARENNIDWVFRRSEVSEEGGAARIASLARAVHNLANTQKMLSSDDWLTSVLNLEKSDWRADAVDEVLDCRPPLFELAPRTGGMAIARWLLHRILPYPTFLIDEADLRARLRVDDLSGAADLFNAIEPYKYTGLLADFSGPRWWRAGIEAWLFELTEGQSGDAVMVAATAQQLGGIAHVRWLRPVVPLTESLVRGSTMVEVDQTVRVRPDDWPPYADDAFARISDASSSPSLSRIVERQDRYLLEDRHQ